MPSRQTSSTATPRSRTSGAAARNEIIATLKDDHKQVKKLFRDFEKLDVHKDSQSCQAIVTKTCTALEMHTTLEEELFYPAARDCLPDEDLIDEAEVEHASAKELIAQLKQMKPEDDKYAATFTVLGEYVQHHIREEENEMFPQISKARFDWQSLQQQMAERRSALTRESQPQKAHGTGDAQSRQTRTSGNRGQAKPSQVRTNAGKSSAAPESDHLDLEFGNEEE